VVSDSIEKRYYYGFDKMSRMLNDVIEEVDEEEIRLKPV
jgi:hypothetical protein